MIEMNPPREHACDGAIADERRLIFAVVHAGDGLHAIAEKLDTIEGAARDSAIERIGVELSGLDGIARALSDLEATIAKGQAD